MGWFINRQAEIKGPCGQAEVLELLRRLRARANRPRLEGTESWQTANSVPERKLPSAKRDKQVGARPLWPHRRAASDQRADSRRGEGPAENTSMRCVTPKGGRGHQERDGKDSAEAQIEATEERELAEGVAHEGIAVRTPCAAAQVGSATTGKPRPNSSNRSPSPPSLTSITSCTDLVQGRLSAAGSRWGEPSERCS